MARAWPAFVGAAVLGIVLLALVEHEERAGPYDIAWDAAEVPVTVQGEYEARGPGTDVAGICVVQPCAPELRVDLTFYGLPSIGPYYHARLQGEGTDVILGPLEETGEGHMLRWTAAEDHTGADRIVVHLARQPIFAVPVQGGAPQQVDVEGVASWPTPRVPSEVHLAEIGGAEISTVVKAHLPFAPPEGWDLVARVEGIAGPVPLGSLEPAPDGSVLDARVERLRLEDQQRVVVLLRPDGSEQGFPLLVADLPPG